MSEPMTIEKARAIVDRAAAEVSEGWSLSDEIAELIYRGTEYSSKPWKHDDVAILLDAFRDAELASAKAEIERLNAAGAESLRMLERTKEEAIPEIRRLRDENEKLMTIIDLKNVTLKARGDVMAVLGLTVEDTTLALFEAKELASLKEKADELAERDKALWRDCLHGFQAVNDTLRLECGSGSVIIKELIGRVEERLSSYTQASKGEQGSGEGK